MPRIVVFHISMGTGHTSAAKAIGEALSRYPDTEVIVEDVLAFIDDWTRTAINTAYDEFSTKAQTLYKLFKSSLNTENAQDALNNNRLLTMLGRPILSDFEKYLARIKPDALIYTMQIPLHVGQFYARQVGIPEYAVITDFSVQSSWLRENVTRYFVASELTRDVLISRNIPADTITVTGIPVRQEIASAKDSQATRQQHDLPLDKPVITFIGSGIRPERARYLVEQLLESRHPGTLVVVAGRTIELIEKLATLDVESPMQLQVLEYIDWMDDLIVASDVVISKPGGLITSEILARGTPMIVIDPIPGQEEWNGDYVAGVGAGIQIRMPELVPPAVLNLLNQPERLHAMRTQADTVGHPEAAHTVAEHVMTDLQVRKPKPH